MARTLRLSFNLKRIIMRTAHVIVAVYSQREQECRSAPLRTKCSPTWPATKSVPRHRSTGRWRTNVEIHLSCEDVRTTGTGIASSEYHITGKLMLDVQVELLHFPLLEIEILGLQCSRKGLRIQR